MRKRSSSFTPRAFSAAYLAAYASGAGALSDSVRCVAWTETWRWELSARELAGRGLLLAPPRGGGGDSPW